MAMAGAKVNVQKGTVKLKVLGEKVKLQVFQPIYPHNVIKEVFSTDLVKGNQAKRERIFGPLNPPKPLIQDLPLPVTANQELQELSYLDDDMFEDFVNSYGKNDREFVFSLLESEPDIFVAPLPAHKTEASLTYVPPDLDLDPYSSIHKPQASGNCIRRIPDMIQYVESLAQPEAEIQAPIQAVEQPVFPEVGPSREEPRGAKDTAMCKSKRWKPSSQCTLLRHMSRNFCSVNKLD
ncbi:hypothetical protein M0R45_016110 [Rubus argutus]|uniref:Uncharacterized protein n=1 Tax=Rubus argutus TaxID=59490 RepID=A0AAW1XS58_RUBAR